MPPKRNSTNSAPAKGAKKSKVTDIDPAEAELKPILDKRWSAVSVSRNADCSFRLRTADRVDAFTYVCLGCAPWRTEIHEDEDEEDETDEEELEKRKRDDAEADKETTLEPASEHPNEKWIFTNAGISKWMALRQQTSVRDPDNFEMHVYNDYFGYGIMELVENLLVDFEEATGDWKMQWAICEGTGLYFQMSAIMQLVGCEDGETVNAVFIAFGTMFLTMLATLERNDILKPDSEIKNIGAVMGMFIRFMVDLKDYGINWPQHEPKIKAYAAKHDIKIYGLNDPCYEEPSDEVEIPEATAGANDPWGWKQAITKLRENKDEPLGGDSKDITSWTPAERRKASFDKKDPIPRSALNRIKQGLIMELA
ncbi:hypothetical protein N7457_003035 [Penicillium paradoxum]|uniref:uncharacterized protein n=1 Tax=Penicillium paradoxum TaxID=176176 RepID=UPI00254675C0|nr:uncharacterized protein N7457_003035 [Penicillium paradoxum]KAJ5788045.1 hypothetical protein N7457_003035 [Penicillium paradoxum]